MLQRLLQTWLQNAAKAKLHQAITQAATQQLTADASPNDVAACDDIKPCHVGFVFALGIESGCFEDKLQGAITVRGDVFSAREGGLHGRRVAIARSGPGRENARQTTELLIDGHRPGCVISAGFAGALSPELKRNAIFVADRVICEAGGNTAELSTEPDKKITFSGVHRGTLLTVDRIVRFPTERRALFQRFGAAAVDMETFAVAEVCQQRQTPFLSIRVINDLANETLPPDMEYIMSRRSTAGQVGAALGALLNRPGSAKDMFHLRENALVASDVLAKFLRDLVKILPVTNSQ